MPTDRLTRLRYWPGAAYTRSLTRLWAETHPRDTAEVVAVPDARRAPDRVHRFAVVCHVFYPELLDELAELFERLPARTDLHLSVVREKHRELVEQRLAGWERGEVSVRLIENRGRDIAPKYVAFADVLERDYHLVLFLHTKRTTMPEIGDPWRHHLFSALAGSPEIVEGVLALFESRPDLGVAAPTPFPGVAATTGWDGNYAQAVRLARRMGLPVRRWAPPDFPAGSMFWARPAALAPIRSLGLRPADFPPEAGQVAYTVMHALERLVFASAARAGYRSVLLRSDAADDVALPRAPIAPSAGGRDAPGVGMRLRAVVPAAAEMAGEIRSRIRVPWMRAKAGLLIQEARKRAPVGRSGPNTPDRLVAPERGAS